MGTPAFDVAHAEGRDMTTADLFAYALDEPSSQTEAAERATSQEDSLTPRERQVARLVSEGLTNREIADRLVISTRTAEGHVERILAKLGFISRTQVVALVNGRR